MDDNEYSFDIGQNAEELGFAYLFVRFILPVIFALVVIAVLGVFLVWFLKLMLTVRVAYGSVHFVR